MLLRTFDMLNAPAISVENLSAWRRSRSGQSRVVLHDISFEIRAGERVIVAGPNGAGKSSLLLSLVGALGTEGRIRISGRELSKESLEELRQEVGLVFEDPREQLFLDTVADEVAFGPRQQGLQGDELEARVSQALGTVKLNGFEKRHPLALSFGEQRRLAVASILSCEPRIVLFDEPTANLDPLARRMMLDVIRAANSTVVVATHDLDAALELGESILLLNDGVLVDSGQAHDVLNDEQRLAQAGLALPLTVAARRQGGRI